MRYTVPRSLAQFRVHVGYSLTGRDRWVYFVTLPDACAYAQSIFEARGVVVAVEAVAA